MTSLVVALPAGIILYLGFHFGLAAHRWQRLFEKRGLKPARAQAMAVLIRRLLGGVYLGSCAVATVYCLGHSPLSFGLGLPPWTTGALWLGGASTLLIPIVVFAAKGEAVQFAYPEIRLSIVSRRTVLLSAFAWAIYLFGYELFFRGFLLFELDHALGKGPALAITTTLYCLAHLHKDRREIVSCLPMGVIFGLMAFDTGGVWVPFLVHLGIAVASETAAARFNPEVHWWANDEP